MKQRLERELQRVELNINFTRLRWNEIIRLSLGLSLSEARGALNERKDLHILYFVVGMVLSTLQISCSHYMYLKEGSSTKSSAKGYDECGARRNGKERIIAIEFRYL